MKRLMIITSLLLVGCGKSINQKKVDEVNRFVNTRLEALEKCDNINDEVKDEVKRHFGELRKYYIARIRSYPDGRYSWSWIPDADLKNPDKWCSFMESSWSK